MLVYSLLVWSSFLLFSAAGADSFLQAARDRQDLTALQQAADRLRAEAGKKSGDPAAHYKLAVAESYVAEVATELKDKGRAKEAAERGIKSAEQAISLKSDSAEYHRVLGTLCGQVIPANVLVGLKYGKCAKESIDKAIQLDGKNALAYVSRGVGNYYLPPSFGGGVDLAIKDFNKAIEINPKLGEAHLWLGIALRKAGRNAEAHAALTKASQLNPERLWAKQQLEKTPLK